jgi:predicted Fe-Mo cluster-binding NifX family protein
MKLAVSTTGRDLEAQLDPRFGRCSYFLIIDPDTMEFEVFDNGSATLGSGAGIQAAQFVAAKGAGAVITGHCGPKAMEVLTAAGIQVFAGQNGSIRDVVGAYKNGDFTPIETKNQLGVHSQLSVVSCTRVCDGFLSLPEVSYEFDSYSL